MRKQKGFILTDFIAGVFTIAALLAVTYGYVNNMVQLYHCDFKPSYKAEVTRTIGVFIAPIGIVIGYIDLDDGE